MKITALSHPALAETLAYSLMPRPGMGWPVEGLELDVNEEEASYLETALQKLTNAERGVFADGDEEHMMEIAKAYDLEPANDLLNRIYDRYFFPPAPQPGAHGNQLD